MKQTISKTIDTNTLGADKLGASGDIFYEKLMTAHETLTEPQSHALNARLVLLMANHIGDLNKLEDILALAGAYHD